MNCDPMEYGLQDAAAQLPLTFTNAQHAESIEGTHRIQR